MDSFATERLLLAFLRGERPAPSLSPPASFLELCRRHRVGPLVFQAAARQPDAVPADLLPGLKEASRKTLVDNLVLLRALREVASALAEEGTGFVLLKGVSLLSFLYPEIHLRPMTDLDLLIREKDWPKVAETLGARGCRLPSDEEERYYRERWYHQLVETPGPPSCYVEFHWNLESVERSRIDPDELIRDAVPCEIEGQRFLRLCDDHLLLHLATHLAHHHADPALLWTEDLRRLLQRGNLDWERLRKTARAWGVANCVAYSLQYVEKIYPGTVPPPARRFTLSPARRAILRGVGTANPILPHRALAGSAARHAVSMALLDRWSDAARYVAAHSVSRVGRALGLLRGTPAGAGDAAAVEKVRAARPGVRR
ncbi:MAG TPA: nucleotidyltransferase family protein [Candidatus Polarisedimenticolia bacterium]|jgi:hypothetical protein|nr:nucleotidyltransferase family protein [Candidatus Polarisedimenticolia bacterium]